MKTETQFANTLELEDQQLDNKREMVDQEMSQHPQEEGEEEMSELNKGTEEMEDSESDNNFKNNQPKVQRKGSIMSP